MQPLTLHAQGSGAWAGAPSVLCSYTDGGEDCGHVSALYLMAIWLFNGLFFGHHVPLHDYGVLGVLLQRKDFVSHNSDHDAHDAQRPDCSHCDTDYDADGAVAAAVVIFVHLH